MRATILALCASAALVAAAPAHAADWPRFGFDAARSNAFAGTTGITRANLHSLQARRVELPGTPDTSPVYLHGVRVAGALHDVFVATTSYGRTLALDANTGAVLWRFDPAGIAGWEGGKQITEASPVADPERAFVYAAAGDGRIHKLALATGAEQQVGGWPAPVTRDPGHEKIAAALNLSGDLVIASTSSYGDGPPYQGHVVTIDRSSGQLRGVFNVLCSDVHALLQPGQCPETGGAIWARGGVVVDPRSGDLLVATANGRFDGRTNWGDSVLELSPDAQRLIGHWTPPEQSRLDAGDLDFGSSAPAPVPYGHARLVVQGNKDGMVRLIDLRRHRQVQAFRAVGSSSVRTAPAVWRRGRGVTVFLATNAGTAAYRVRGTSRRPKLARQWFSRSGGTSPVLAGGLLYVYDQLHGRLVVLDPRTGATLRALHAARGHWSSPVVADGRIALGTGNANEHQTSGSLFIYRIAGAG